MTNPVIQPMMRQLWPALRMLAVMTALLGLAYPLAVTGVSQVVFSGRADGSFLEHGGAVVGSELIGQSFAGRPEYFQGRPSAAGDGYDPLATSASNQGPESEILLAAIGERRAAAAALDGTPPDSVAPDALTASASGLDPHISPEYAAQQVERVARERGLSIAQVEGLVERYTDSRSWGFLGEPGVNVLLLNLALDRITETAD